MPKAFRFFLHMYELELVDAGGCNVTCKIGQQRLMGESPRIVIQPLPVRCKEAVHRVSETHPAREIVNVNESRSADLVTENTL